MDGAFKTGRYPGYTVSQLKQFIELGKDVEGIMAGEIDRRAKVNAGDVTVMSPGERLRYLATGKAR